MIESIPIEYPGIKEIIKNINFYKEKFLNDSIIVFRNANLSLDQQREFHLSLGKHFNWTTASNWYYEENHEKNPAVGVAGCDEIMLNWHVEHFYYSNPIIVGTWNMFNFSCSSECGKTYFVDTSLIYKILNKDMQNFLKSCILDNSGMEKISMFAKSPLYSPVVEHWATKNPVIRLPLHDRDVKIDSVNGNIPTDKDYEQFETITKEIKDIVRNNQDIRIVQKWQQGDLVLMDAFKLAHAVTGGFDSKDRTFFGIWGHRDPIDDK